MLESTIQAKFRKYIEPRGWYSERTHGNQFQSGIPDLYLMHPTHGTRWVDMKRPKGYRLTKAQQIKWPLWERYGVGIWIVTDPGQAGYQVLFGPPNWRDYAPGGPSIAQQSEELESLIDELSTKKP